MAPAGVPFLVGIDDLAFRPDYEARVDAGGAVDQLRHALPDRRRVRRIVQLLESRVPDRVVHDLVGKERATIVDGTVQHPARGHDAVSILLARRPPDHAQQQQRGSNGQGRDRGSATCRPNRRSAAAAIATTGSCRPRSIGVTMVMVGTPG